MGGGGTLQKFRWGYGVRRVFDINSLFYQTKIYDFSLTYLRPEPKIDTLFQNRPYPETASVNETFTNGYNSPKMNDNDYKCSFVEQLYT